MVAALASSRHRRRDWYDSGGRRIHHGARAQLYRFRRLIRRLAGGIYLPNDDHIDDEEDQ